LNTWSLSTTIILTTPVYVELLKAIGSKGKEPIHLSDLCSIYDSSSEIEFDSPIDNVGLAQSCIRAKFIHDYQNKPKPSFVIITGLSDDYSSPELEHETNHLAIVPNSQVIDIPYPKPISAEVEVTGIESSSNAHLMDVDFVQASTENIYERFNL